MNSKSKQWTRWRACRPAAKFLFLLAAGFLVLLAPVSAQVTIEIVNDSGLPDTNVFVKVPGYLIGAQPTMVPTNLFVNLSNAAPANPLSLPLSTLATEGSAAPYQMVSPISGNTDTVYSIQIDFINSGGIYFTYGQPFDFTNKVTPSPPPDSSGNAYRYDYAEFTINNTNAANNAVDVTYVDKFGIPLQLEWFQGTNANLVSGSYVYASTRTLASRFAAAGLGEAVFALNASNITPGWQYSGPNAYTNFARILSPQKVSGTNTSVAPYPDIANYLNSLVGGSNSFWLNGASPQGGYRYVGYNVSVSTNTNGWVVTLAQAPNPPRFDPSKITGVAYTNTITFPITYANASQFVYGAPVGPNFYSVNGVLVTNTAGATYNVETWMIGDVLSSLNFGFWDGRYGTNSADWFSPVEWTAFPFGSARTTTDGFYNPYAALIYNNADPYSFAFSERITPDVLMSPGNGDRVRITLLPDDRLDSPIVSTPGTNAITANSITLNWGEVAGATGYQVNVLRPLGIPPVSVMSSNATSYTLANLQPGTPYVMSVQAVGTGASGNPIITPARPVYATTAGTTPTNGGTFTQVQATFSVSDPYYQLAKVYINGTGLFETNTWLTTNGVPARWIASVGTNQVVVTVVGASNQVLFNDWLTFVLSPAFAVTNDFYGTNYTLVTNRIFHTVTNIASPFSTNTVTLNSAISGVFLHGQKLSQAPPGASGFLSPMFFFTSNNIPNIPGFPTNYVANSNSFLVSTQNPCLSIGLTYVPAETRKYAPLTTSALPVSLTGLTMLANGMFQFEYADSSGQSYSVYASTNLTGWVNLGSAALVSPGLYQFTDPGATNYPLRFYQLRSP